MLHLNQNTLSRTSKLRLAGLIVITALMFGFANPAAASFASCTGTGYDISNNVTPSSDCAILEPLDGADNDVPQPGFVNDKEFFGFDDWLFDGKHLDNPTPTLLAFTGDAQLGTFTKADTDNPIWDDIENVMLVFKDGSDTNLVAYLLDIGDLNNLSGNYKSPFEEPPFTFTGNGSRDISHISVYFRGEEGLTPPQQIPEPSLVLLMGLGLLGFGATRIRKIQ